MFKRVRPFSFNLKFKTNIMKAIIFFVAFGRASADDVKNAKLIAQATDERVVFRNASVASASGEKPEPCEAYAGLVPDTEAYKGKAVYSVNKSGEVVKDVSDEDEETEELNKIGLPIGSPTTAKELKAVFDEHELEYHKGAKIGALVELYRSEILVLGNE